MTTGIVFDHISNTLNEGDLVMLHGVVYQIKEIEMTGSTMAIKPTIKLVKLRLISDISMVVEGGKKIKDLYKLQNPSVKDATDLASVQMDEGKPS